MSVSIHFQALPPETAAFFDDHGEEREVTADGIRVSIDEDGDVMYDDGATIDLSKLPPGTTKIRVYASC